MLRHTCGPLGGIALAALRNANILGKTKRHHCQDETAKKLFHKTFRNL